MIRQIILAATAAALIASPASAAESIRIATAGKTVERLHSEIRVAARKVCNREAVAASLLLQAYASCYDHAVSNAKAQLLGNAPQQQQLAKN